MQKVHEMVGFGILICIFTSVFLVSMSPVQAYVTKETLSGETIRWFKSQDDQIEFYIHPSVEFIASMEDFTEAFHIASSAWADTEGVPQIVLKEGAPEDINHRRIGQNVISVPDEWQGNENQLAITITTYDTATGEIVDTDIEFNPDHFILFIRHPESLSEQMAFDLAAVMTHEIGHTLGLDESDNDKATMWCKIQPGQTYQRLLHKDDIEGAKQIYVEGKNPDELLGSNKPMQCQINMRSDKATFHLIFAFFLGIWSIIVIRSKVSSSRSD